ncbi:MAG: TonB-dependent receptor plug domain-containing protein [Paludibacteraceae bacterium]|nr:TonB-dependent receptor plug domain-containing protein [Paludibacteraceae bacterium]
MRKSVFILLTIMSISLHAQQAKQIVDMMSQQLQEYPQEKVILLTDHDRYLPGQTIHLCVMVRDAATHAPSGMSRYAYVELTGTDGIVQQQLMLSGTEGTMASQMKLPADLPTGRYCLRAYTRYSNASTPEYETLRPIIIGREKRPEFERPAGKTSITAGRTLQSTVRNKKLYVRIHTDAATHPYLLLHCRGMIYYCAQTAPQTELKFKTDNIPAGVSQITLLDDSLNIIDQELVYIDAPAVELKSRVTRLSTDSIEVVMQLPRQLSTDTALLCLSIDTAKIKSDLRSRLLLLSDLNFPLSNPLPLTNTPQGRYALSELLHNANWTRYDLQSVIHGDLQLPVREPEQWQHISGSVVMTHGGEPEAATVDLLSLQNGTYNGTHTDLDGRYAFDSLDFRAGAAFVVQAKGDIRGRQIRIKSDADELPLIRPDHRRIWDNPFANIFAPYDSTFEGRQMMLGEIVVKHRRKRRPPETREIQTEFADASYDQDFIDEVNATCLHDLLRRIPGMRIIGDKVYIRAATSTVEHLPIVIAIDGVLMDYEYNLDDVQMPDVARVEIYRTGTTAIWGPRGGSGVVSITTKRAGGIVFNPNRDMRVIRPLGYTPYEPSLNSLHSDWIPAVQLTAEPVVLRMRCPQGAGLNIQGISNNGCVIEQHLKP